MNIKRLVDTVVAGTGMGLIHSAVKIKDGKLADNNKLLLLGRNFSVSREVHIKCQIGVKEV